MHVSPVKHGYAWLPRNCDYRTDTHSHTDRQTDGQTDRRQTKWSLCAVMLRRRHNNTSIRYDTSPWLPVLCSRSLGSSLQMPGYLSRIGPQCEAKFHLGPTVELLSTLIYEHCLIFEMGWGAYEYGYWRLLKEQNKFVKHERPWWQQIFKHRFF